MNTPTRKPERWVHCPVCHIDLCVRKDGKVPVHLPNRASVHRNDLPICVGSNNDATDLPSIDL